jgi:hypothetical protein
MIKTKRLKYVPDELFKIYIIRYTEKHWWLFVLIWIMAILLIIIDNHDSFTYFFLGF